MSNPNPNLIVSQSDWNIFSTQYRVVLGSGITVYDMNNNYSIVYSGPYYDTINGWKLYNVAYSEPLVLTYGVVQNLYALTSLNTGINQTFTTIQNNIYIFSYQITIPLVEVSLLTISINGIVIPSCTINNFQIAINSTTYSTIFIASASTQIVMTYYLANYVKHNSSGGQTIGSTSYYINVQNLNLQKATLAQIFDLKDYLQFNYIALHNAGYLDSDILSNATNSLPSGYAAGFMNSTWTIPDYIRNGINVTYSKLIAYNKSVNQTTLIGITAAILAASPYKWSLVDLINSGYQYSDLSSLFNLNNNNIIPWLTTINELLTAGILLSILQTNGFIINQTTNTIGINIYNLALQIISNTPINITTIINDVIVYNPTLNSTQAQFLLIASLINVGVTCPQLVTAGFTLIVGPGLYNTLITYASLVLAGATINGLINAKFYYINNLVKNNGNDLNNLLGYSSTITYNVLINSGYTINADVIYYLVFLSTWTISSLSSRGFNINTNSIVAGLINLNGTTSSNNVARIDTSIARLNTKGFTILTSQSSSRISLTTATNINIIVALINAGATYNSLYNAGYLINGIIISNSNYSNINILFNANATYNSLINFGFSYSNFISAGYTITPTILTGLGYTATSLKALGWSLSDLINSGYSYTALLSAGFNAGFTILNGLGFTLAILKASPYNWTLADLINSGYSYTTLLSAGFSAGFTILNGLGFTAAILKALNWTLADLIISGYSYTALLSAGYTITPTILIGLGFTAAILKASPYNWSLVDLIKSGFSYTTLINLGYTINQSTLTGQGLDTSSLKALGWTLSELINSGYSYTALLSAGFNAGFTILNGLGFTAAILKASPYNWYLSELIKSGFSYTTLINLGFTINQSTLTGQGIDASSLKILNWSLSELINSGYACSTLSPIFNFTADNNSYYSNTIIQSLINSGFSYTTLNNAKFLINVTILTGIGNSSTNANFTATSLKALGWSITDLNMNGYGYTLNQVIVAGFTYSQIKSKYIVNTNTLISAGYGISVSGPQKLLILKWTLSELKSCGFLFNDLINCIGVTAANLYSVGFTLNDFVQNGYSYSALTNAGLPVPIIYANLQNITAITFYNNGWTAANLYSANFPVGYFLNNLSLYPLSTLISAGYNILLHFILTGYSYTLLIGAGFTINYTILNGLGLTIASLAAKGWTATDLINAGFSLSLLVNANLGTIFLSSVTSLSILINQGYTYQQLVVNNNFQITRQILTSYYFTVASLKVLGWSASDLKNVGYRLIDLINALFSYTQLSVAFVGGVTKSSLIKIGYTSDILISRYKWSADDLHSAGF